MVGYLFSRWTTVGWSPWRVIGTSALIRGGYHLYQGFGGFVGNAVMGVVFGWLYQRTRRVGPLVVAHTLLDVVAFVGYTLARDHLGWLRSLTVDGTDHTVLVSTSWAAGGLTGGTAFHEPNASTAGSAPPTWSSRSSALPSAVTTTRPVSLSRSVST